MRRVEFGDRFIPCHQGDPMTPLSISGRMAITPGMPQMADRMIKRAPQGTDLKSWRYQ